MPIISRNRDGLVSFPPIVIPEYTPASRQNLADIIRGDEEFQILLRNVFGEAHRGVVLFCLAALTGAPTLQDTAELIGKSPERVRQIFYQLYSLVRRKCDSGQWFLDLAELPPNSGRSRYRLLYILIHYLYAVRHEYRSEFLPRQPLSLSESRLLARLINAPDTDFWTYFAQHHYATFSNLSRQTKAKFVRDYLAFDTLKAVADRHRRQPSTVEASARKIVNHYAGRQKPPATFNHSLPKNKRSHIFYRWYLARMVIEYYYTDYQVDR